MLCMGLHQCEHIALECVPGLKQLATDLTDPALRDAESFGSGGRGLAIGQKHGDLLQATRQSFDPCGKIDSHDGRIRRPCAPVLNENLAPASLVQVGTIQTFDDDVLSLLAIVAGNIVNIETIADFPAIANLRNSNLASTLARATLAFPRSTSRA